MSFLYIYIIFVIYFQNYDTLNAALTLSEDKPLDFVNLLKTGELKLPERIKLVDVINCI